MHIFWGILLLANGGPIETTGTLIFREIAGAGHYQFRAITYIVSGLLPAALLWRPGSVVGLLSVIPQQVLLTLSGIGAVVAVSSGHFADGTVRSLAFIAMDQSIYIFLAVLHSFETLDRFHDHRRALEP